MSKKVLIARYCVGRRGTSIEVATWGEARLLTCPSTGVDTRSARPDLPHHSHLLHWLESGAHEEHFYAEPDGVSTEYLVRGLWWIFCYISTKPSY